MLLLALSEVVAARQLGLHDYGSFASVTALATIVGAAMCLGLPQLALKALRAPSGVLANAGDGSVGLEGAMVSKLTMMHCGLILALGSVAILMLRGDYSWALQAYVLLPASIAAKVGLRRILTGLDRPREGLVADEIAPVLFFFALVLVGGAVSAGPPSSLQFVSYLCIANVISVVWILLRDRSRLGVLASPQVSVGGAVGVYREALHFVPFVFAFIAAKKVDVALLHMMTNSSSTALYAAAAKLAMPGLAVSSAVNMLATRELADAYHSRSRVRFYGALRRGARISLLVAAPYYLIVALCSKELLRIVFGADFVPGWDVLLVLCVGALVTASSGPILIAFSVTDLSRSLSRLTFYYLIALALLVVALSAWMGALGAAVATVIAGAMYRSQLWRQIRMTTRDWSQEASA